MGGSTQNEPEKFAELAARYELDFDPDSIPGLVQRFDLRFPGDPVQPASRIVSRGGRPTGWRAPAAGRGRAMPTVDLDRVGAEPPARSCVPTRSTPSDRRGRRRSLLGGREARWGVWSTGKRRLRLPAPGVPSGSSWRSAATSGIVSPRMSVRREITSSSSSPGSAATSSAYSLQVVPGRSGQLDGEGSVTRGLQIRRQPLEAPLSVPGTVDQAEGGHCGGATSVAADQLLRDPQGSVERALLEATGPIAGELAAQGSCPRQPSSTARRGPRG